MVTKRPSEKSTGVGVRVRRRTPVVRPSCPQGKAGRWADRASRQRGQALWEMALGFLLLFVIMVHVIGFGRVFFLYHNVLTSVRMAARYAVSHPYTNPAHRRAVQRLVVYGQTTGPFGGAQIPGLSVTDVEVTPNPSATGPPQFITVRATIRINAFALLGEFDMYPEVTMRYLQLN